MTVRFSNVLESVQRRLRAWAVGFREQSAPFDANTAVTTSPAAVGRVLSLNTSAGGVPKLPVAKVEVGPTGMRGDVQRDTKHHGGSERALCVYAVERIRALAAEGHPVNVGALGENLTLEGIDWARVTPGARLVFRPGSGERARVEAVVTSYTTPCKTIAHCFVDRRFARIHQRRHPGWSRVYCRIELPGWLAVGDQVEVLAPRVG